MKRVAIVGAAVVLAVAGAVALGQAGGGLGKVQITVGKETTAVMGPMRADGTVDYVAAVNAKYGAGVTAENNGYVKWLEVMGTGDDILNAKTKVEVLRLLGMKEVPAGTEVWKGLNVPGGELMAASEGMWKESEHRELAAYLKGQEKLLAKVKEAAGAEKWWMPAVAKDGRTMLTTSMPSLGMVREVGNELAARAALRAGSGDVNGALADLWVVRRLARQVGGGATMIERLVGVAMDSQATKTLGGVAASGQLTEAQCKAVAGTLDAFGPLPGMVEAVDCYERWMILDLVQLIPSGQKTLAQTAAGDDMVGIMAAVKVEEVDWDAVLKFCNGLMDEEMAAMRKPKMAEMRAAIATVENRMEAMAKEVEPWSKAAEGYKKGANETRAAYSERIGKVLVSMLMPTFGRAAELERRASQQVEMVRVVVGAAEMKARTGKWPGRAEELVPEVLKELPRDAYSAGEAEPFKYVVRNGGVRVYSVGENGKDDGGVRDAGGKDDLGVGVK